MALASWQSQAPPDRTESSSQRDPTPHLPLLDTGRESKSLRIELQRSVPVSALMALARHLDQRASWQMAKPFALLLTAGNRCVMIPADDARASPRVQPAVDR